DALQARGVENTCKSCEHGDQDEIAHLDTVDVDTLRASSADVPARCERGVAIWRLVEEKLQYQHQQEPPENADAQVDFTRKRADDRKRGNAPVHQVKETD